MSNEQIEIDNGVDRLAESIFDRLAQRLEQTPEIDNVGNKRPDVICLSHLRWDFVYQRPQHLLTRCAAERRVFFIEEPIFDNGSLSLEVNESCRNLYVVASCPTVCTVKWLQLPCSKQSFTEDELSAFKGAHRARA